MAESGLLCVSGVVATRAGLISIPTDIQTIRSLGFMIDDIMTESGLLCVSGIVATRAGLKSIPTDIQTIGSLCFVIDDIMAESRQNLNIKGCEITNFAVNVALPATFKTSSCLSIHKDPTGTNGMIQLLIQLLSAGNTVFRNHAGGIRTGIVVAEGINIILDLFETAILTSIGRKALLRTGGSRHNRVAIVRKNFGEVFLVGVTATALVQAITLLGTSRINHPVHNVMVLVLQGRNDLFFNRTANRAFARFKARSLLGRIRYSNPTIVGAFQPNVTGSNLDTVGIAVATNGTSMGGVAILGASRLKHYAVISVTGSADKDIITADTGLILSTGGICAGFVSQSGNGHLFNRIQFTYRTIDISFPAVLQTSGILGRNKLTHGIVVQTRNLTLLYQDSMANRTMRTFRVAHSNASRCNGRICDGRMACSRDFLIGGIIATRAVFISIPTDVQAIGSLGFMIDDIMTESGLLCVGGVIATRAGLVSIPTDIQTIRSLCFVIDDIMAESGLLCIGGIVATRAGLISIPTDIQTIGSLGFVIYNIMTESGLLCVSGIVATRAGLISIPTDVETIRSLGFVIHYVVIQRIGEMIRATISAYRASMGGISDVGAGRRSDNGNIVMRCFFGHDMLAVAADFFGRTGSRRIRNMAEAVHGVQGRVL